MINSHKICKEIFNINVITNSNSKEAKKNKYLLLLSGCNNRGLMEKKELSNYPATFGMMIGNAVLTLLFKKHIGVYIILISKNVYILIYLSKLNFKSKALTGILTCLFGCRGVLYNTYPQYEELWVK